MPEVLFQNTFGEDSAGSFVSSTHWNATHAHLISRPLLKGANTRDLCLRITALVMKKESQNMLELLIC